VFRNSFFAYQNTHYWEHVFLAKNEFLKT